MSFATFLSNDQLWRTLSARLKSARHVGAAIAYIGSGGARLLALQRGAHLVVDMSHATVRAGITDPREVEKLIQRGVIVFTRRDLHAKLVVADSFVITGSANVSKRSHDLLDEAALLTNEASAIRRAREFVNRLCTEPVRPKYLALCKRIYRPPRFGAPGKAGKHQSRVSHAKLWVVNLREFSIPDSELAHFKRAELKAQKLLRDATRSRLESFSWPYKPRMADELELGDWVIQVVKYRDGRVLVQSPGQFLCCNSHVRDVESGKERYVFSLEVPIGGESFQWREFTKAAKGVLGSGEPSRRTKAIRNQNSADELLRLWTRAGRVSRR